MSNANLTLFTASGTVVKPGSTLANLAGRWLMAYESPRTREAYGDALGLFATFIAEHRAGDVMTATRSHLDAWARAMEAAELKPATRARNLAALSSFYTFAVSEGVLAANPASAVRRPKVSDKSTRLGLTLETSRQVLKAAEAMSATHKAAVALLLCAGLRASEACNVTAAHIGESLGHTVLAVKGKGGEVSPVVLSPVAMRLLSEALAAASSGGHLLQDTTGKPLNRFQLGRIVARIGKKAQLGRVLTPHDLRHGCITSALEAGEPIHLVQAHARHASPVTTQRYDRNRGLLDNSAAYGLGRALAQ
jgi:site-specific recombinase XerD